MLNKFKKILLVFIKLIKIPIFIFKRFSKINKKCVNFTLVYKILNTVFILGTYTLF